MKKERATKSIKVTGKTKKLLDGQKEYPRESYDDVIAKLLKKGGAMN